MENLERKYRKWQSSLIVTGKIIIAMGIWDVIRTFVDYFIRTDQSAENDLNNNIGIRIFMFIMIAILISIRMFVGYSAVSEGKGGKKRYLYLVISVIMIGVNVIGAISFISSMFKSLIGIDTALVSCLFDILSAASLIEMFISSIMVKSIGKKLKEEA